jgi:hypothetical protein
MSRAAHEIALQAWVEAVLTPLSISPTIYSDQRGPRPDKPYASVLIISDVQVGQLEERDPVVIADYTPQIRSQREGTVEVQIYGPGHTDAAHLLETSLRRQSILDLNEAAGISVERSLAGVQRISMTTNGVIEDRSLVEFLFRYTFIDSFVTTEYVQATETTGVIS